MALAPEPQRACRMYRILSADRDELKTIRSQLKKIIKESPVSDVVAKTIRQVQAVITSVTAAIVAHPTAGRHHPAVVVMT